jgi:hypothetical protein
VIGGQHVEVAGAQLDRLLQTRTPLRRRERARRFLLAAASDHFDGEAAIEADRLRDELVPGDECGRLPGRRNDAFAPGATFSAFKEEVQHRRQCGVGFGYGHYSMVRVRRRRV